MSAISSSPTSGRSVASPSDHSSSSWRLRGRQLALGVAQVGRFLELLGLDRGLLFAPRLFDFLLEVAVDRRRAHRLDPHPRGGLVDQVDRLVGQEAVGDVAVGQLGGGLQRVVGDVDLVVLLVALAQPLEDLDRVLDRGLVDLDLGEAALQRRVALEVFAVLVERRRADRLQLAAGQRRLQDRGGVDRALGGAGADQVVELVDEEDDVAALGDLFHHLLEALLELAAVLGAGDQRRQVERVDLLVAQQLGHLAVVDPRGQALDHGGLADAGLAQQHRVVLGAAREDLHDPLDLGLAADHRVELALLGELGQVAAELVEQFRALFAGALALTASAAALAAAAGAGQHPDHLVADLVGVGVEVEQDAGGDALVLAHQAEQDVLGADVVVAERERLAQRQLEHLLGARRERDLAGGDLLAGADDPHDLGADALGRDVERLEDAGGQALLLAQQAEQDVLGADVVVFQRASLFLGQDHYLTGSLSESLEQRLPLLTLSRSNAFCGRKYRRRPSMYREAPMCPLNDTESAHPALGPRLPLIAAFSTPFRALQERIAGKSTISRRLWAPVSIMTSRSIPSPTPPVGGIPYSSASTNASS